MARYFFILLSMVLPLMGVTPQQLVNGGQLLYNAILSNDLAKQKHAFNSSDRLMILKQAREAAKKNKDAETTQYLTEQIFYHQMNNTRELLKKAFKISVIASSCFLAGWVWRLKQCAQLDGNSQCSDLAFYKYPWI